ncbi:MAG: TrkA family potassium uptake protein [Fimbriimonadaceae bacterium]|nr:TrkA family potassium uptake protein [Fimbriimonadaceae bacterium]
MNILIFGLGRTGAALALQLSRQHSVTIIEQNPDAVRRLGAKHTCNVVIGSGIDEDTLVRAGIATADAFFAVTRGDNTNLMAAQVAQINYKVKHICVRVADPNRAQAYRNLGMTCITPALIIAGMMRDWLTETPYEQIDSYNVLPAEMEVI